MLEIAVLVRCHLPYWHEIEEIEQCFTPAKLKHKPNVELFFSHVICYTQTELQKDNNCLGSKFAVKNIRHP